MFLIIAGFIYFIIGFVLCFCGINAELDSKLTVPKNQVAVLFDRETFKGKSAGFFKGLRLEDGTEIEVWAITKDRP